MYQPFDHLENRENFFNFKMSCSVQIFDNQILKVIIKNVKYLFEKK